MPHRLMCGGGASSELLLYSFGVSMSGKGNCYDNAAVETFVMTI